MVAWVKEENGFGLDWKIMISHMVERSTIHTALGLIGRAFESLWSALKQRIHFLETDLLNTFSSGVAATNGSL